MSTGDSIGVDISTVGTIVSPIVSNLDPPVGAAVTVAFKLLAVLEPAAYNAVATMLQKGQLTPEQQATITLVENKLQNPDSYLAQLSLRA